MINPNVIIDTNVIISSLLSHNDMSATKQVLNLFYDNKINLYYSDDILSEYIEFIPSPIKSFLDSRYPLL